MSKEKLSIEGKMLTLQDFAEENGTYYYWENFPAFIIEEGQLKAFWVAFFLLPSEVREFMFDFNPGNITFTIKDSSVEIPRLLVNTFPLFKQNPLPCTTEQIKEYLCRCREIAYTDFAKMIERHAKDVEEILAPRREAENRILMQQVLGYGLNDLIKKSLDQS